MSDGLSSAPGYTPLDVAKAVAGTVILAFFLSLAYGPVDYYSPLVYLNVVIAGGMGVAVGRCGRALLRRFRIDGTGAATLVGAAGALCALWFSWMSYLWVLFDFDFEAFTAFANPSSLWAMMDYIAENPVWTLSRRGKSMAGGPGLLYWGAWLAEAALFAYFSVTGCRSFVTTNKLCPQCRNWLRPTGDEILFAAPADEAALAGLKAGDLAGLPLMARLPGGAEASEWLTASRHACATCQGLNAHVTVAHSVVKLDKKKKPQTTTAVLANLVEIGPELEAALFEQPPAAPAQPAEQPAETDAAASA